MRKRLRLTFAVLLVMCCSGAVATEYAALPFSAKVVDKETQRPVEGAIAIAVWSLSYYTGHSGGPILNITEAVTGPDGIFQMEGWPPRPPPMGDAASAFVLDTREPALYIFKEGRKIYEGEGLEDTSHYGERFWTGGLVRKPWPANQIFEIASAPDDQKYALAFASPITSSLWFDCWWARNPRMTAALINESNRLQEAYPAIPFALRWTHFESAPADACGNRRNILGQYLK